MEYFDAIIAAIIVILAIKGFFGGFVRESASLLGIVGGVILASRFSDKLGESLNALLKIQSPTLVNLIGFMMIFALVWIAALVAASAVERFTRFANLSRVDMAFGAVIAAAKVFLVLSIIVFTFSKINLLESVMTKIRQSSAAYPVMIKIGDLIVKTDFAKDLQKRATNSLESGLKEIDSAAKNAAKAVNPGANPASNPGTNPAAKTNAAAVNPPATPQ